PAARWRWCARAISSSWTWRPAACTWTWTRPSWSAAAPSGPRRRHRPVAGPGCTWTTCSRRTWVPTWTSWSAAVATPSPATRTERRHAARCVPPFRKPRRHRPGGFPLRRGLFLLADAAMAAPGPRLSRRGFVAALGGAAASLPLLPALALPPPLPWQRGPVRFFPLSDVRLGEGLFARSSALNLRYLAALDMDRLLAPFRLEAGLPSPASRYPNWESMGLDGHTAGHYLSALAQQAAQGSAEMRRRLDYMVAALAEVQAANGDGYVGGVPNGRVLWERIASGDFQAESFALEGAWVPFYNLHKTFAGLRDAWVLAGNGQAREVLVRFADWAGALVANLDDDQLQRVLDTEHGGMNEVLADVYAITGERRYLALARRFSHRAILEPLLRREDRLDGLHANTQIPKVIGFARI